MNNWFLNDASKEESYMYTVGKRCIDINECTLNVGFILDIYQKLNIAWPILWEKIN